MIKDYYSILGVTKRASKEQIKKAYRKLVKMYHPDKNPGNENEFREVTEAYEYIKNHEKTKNEKRFKYKGADLKITVIVRREDLLFQKSKQIKVRRKGLCNTCEGTGSALKTKIPCNLCGGSGLQGLALVLGRKKHCILCGGAGERPKAPLCSKCKGKALMDETLSYTIKLNPYSELFIFKGLGNYCFNGAPGNLIVQLNITEHPKFTIKGLNVYGKKEISPTQAIIGDRIKINAFNKSFSLKIPPGVQNGESLKKRCIVKYKNYTGSLYIEVQIIIPKIITKEQKSLYTKILKSEKETSWPVILAY